MIIASNFKLYSRKFLDERQQSESLEELNENILGKLYPYGFEVFCIQEGKWYQNIAKSGTPIWEERKGGVGGNGGNGSSIDISDIISDEEVSDRKTWSSEYIYSLQSNLEQLITNNEDYITEIEDRLLLVEGELTLLDGFNGSYDSLTNKPTIPSIEGLATETYVNNAIANAQLGGGEGGSVDLSGFATKDDLNTKADINDIPTKISQLDNDSNYLTEIPNEYITEDELNAKNYLTEHQNISHLATKEELNAKADISDIPTNISQLTNDSNFISSIPSEYITETELEDKGYLTEHQDISHLANRNELFSKDYNDLTNKPTIPSIDGLATEIYVNNAIANAQLGGDGTDIDLSGYATKEDLNTKANISDIPINISQLTNDSNFISSIPSEYITEDELNAKNYLTEHQDISHLANRNELFSKDYNDLTNKPNIPSLNGYATETYVKNEIANAQLGGDGTDIDLSGYATKDDLNAKANISDVPTKVSQLTNDSNFITSIPSEYITEIELNNMGYLTEHQDISYLATKEELNTKADTSSIPTKVSDLTNDSNFISSIPSEYITEIELNNMGYLTEHQNISHLATKEELNAKANISDIPTKVSNLTNDSNFISSIPSEYVTEDELNQKGYLTEHQNISHLATKEELFSKDYNDLTNKPNIPSIEGLASEEYVKNEIAKAQLEGESIDLSGYATKDDLDEKANISDIPVNVSQLTNDSGYLTNIPSEYITETELEDKGYLTEHQNISHLATKEELNAKADTSSIPIKTSQLTNDSNFITSIPSEYITENELNNMGYLTSSDISNLATKTELNAKADTSSIPTKTSQLTNDSNFITSIPSEYITETELNNMGYLTSSDISDLATKTELNAKADTSSIPTKVSQLTNDNNYLTSIPSEYITETELNNMGYLTEHQNISHLATKTELFSKDYNDLTNKPTIPTSTSQLTNDSNYATVSQIPSIPTSLPANGGNSDTVNGFSIWSGTQAEYDSIGTKSDTTIYLIRE